MGETFADFPVFARFFDVTTTSWLGVAWNAPVRIGTATVLPGDVVVADETGVLFFPPQLVGDVLRAAEEQAALEEHERELLRSGEHRFRDVYPLSPASGASTNDADSQRGDRVACPAAGEWAEVGEPSGGEGDSPLDRRPQPSPPRETDGATVTRLVPDAS